MLDVNLIDNADGACWYKQIFIISEMVITKKNCYNFWIYSFIRKAFIIISINLITIKMYITYFWNEEFLKIVLLIARFDENRIDARFLYSV